MAKFDLDNLLAELGVGAPQAPEDAPPRPEAAPAPQPARTPLRHDEPAGPALARKPSAEPTREAAPSGIASRDIGRLLLERAVVTPEQMTAARTIASQTPGKGLVDILLEHGADEEKVQRVIAEIEGLPFERLDPALAEKAVSGKHVLRLTPAYCKQQLTLPLREEGSRVVVGVVRPDDVFQLDDVKRRLGVASIKVVVITRADASRILELFGETDGAPEDLEEILSDIQEEDVQIQKSAGHDADLEKQAAESPVIRYVNYILQTAAKEGASDIHVEPGEGKLKVRFRIDGVLFEMMNPPHTMSAAIASRLKIMGGLDIAERRLPQDGRIRVNIQGRRLDLRMSTLPTAGGEKCVMRILDQRSITVPLEDLGMDEDTLAIRKHQIEEPHGIILVTGPTGSGKTTTLYASLGQMDKQKQNISTVEDPIEYHLEGITQTQTHEKIGMSFGRALKALLRQDPDVILIGEIRDQDTATTAIQAALTGHLVLSTLHTNDAPGSVTRLINIGLEPFLVGAALNAVLAQRLVRQICSECKREVAPEGELKEFLEMQGVPIEKLTEGAGCDRCRNTGYSGRVGIYEMLVVDDQIRDSIARNPNVAEFRRLCLERGMTTLRADGWRKVAAGLTTVEEIRRVTESGH